VAKSTKKSEERKTITVQEEVCIGYGTTVGRAIEILQEVIPRCGATAEMVPEGYENYGDFRVQYKRLETDAEYKVRMEKLKTKEQKELERKRKQFERLKKELGEE